MHAASLVLALVSGAFVGDDDPKSDQDRMKGTWTVVKCMVGDQELTSPNGAHELSFEGDTVWITRNGQRAKKSITLKLDASKPVREFDFSDSTYNYKGIYEIDGKKVRICYSPKSRPTQFSSKVQESGQNQVLYELERK